MKHPIKQELKKIFFILIMTIGISCEEKNQQTLIEKDTSIKNNILLENDIRYYSSIVFRETPYARQKGMIKLTKEQAGKRGHYRFIFDEKERVAEISFRQGNQFKTPNHTADYYNMPSTIVRIKYEDNKEIKSFFARTGGQVAVKGSVYNEVYELDDLGNRKTLYFLDINGNRIENNWNVARYTWEIQEDGAVIEKRFNLKNELQPLRPYFPFYITRLNYDSNGYISLMQNIDEYGNLVENETGVAQDKIEFDAHGRWLGWKVLDKDGKLTRGNGPNVSKGINIPDEFGYETSIRYEDEQGNPLINSHGFWGSKRFYDEFGNFVYTYFIDSKGNPGPNEITGYTYAEYEYSKDGMVRLYSRLLDNDKKPIAHKQRGYSIIKDEYDNKNQLIKTSYLDINNQLMNRLDNGIAYRMYAYSEDGEIISRLAFDVDDNEIKN